jgi:hypothetical protein
MLYIYHVARRKRKVKGILEVLLLMVLVSGATACGTIQLNHIITGTECSTREDCIKDLNLPNPAKPDMVFVVDPLLIDEKGRAGRRRTPAFNSTRLHGDVELCIAKALNDEFKNAKTVFDKSGIAGPYININPTSIRKQTARSGRSYMEIDYEVTIRGITTRNIAQTDTETYSSVTAAATKEYPEVCKILADQVRKTLSKE